MMPVGSSWSWKPPRGGSIVKGTPVGRGRSLARRPYANGSAEWGWAMPLLRLHQLAQLEVFFVSPGFVDGALAAV